MSVESIKSLEHVFSKTPQHWVGDGFPVRTLFAYSDSAAWLSPFLLLDHAGPTQFTPTKERRGVGEHPHRGFETVTVVYQGEVEHRDSSGGGGIIGPGDVQWMTAGAGVVHEEFHGPTFARSGGNFEMIQLWVNLPAKDKLTAPRYQAIRQEQIPTVGLPAEAGQARIIAGSLAGSQGPARTFTPINLWDLRLQTDRQLHLSLPTGWTTLLVVCHGEVRMKDDRAIQTGEVGLFTREGAILDLQVMQDTTALLLCGEPIDEPVVGRGPFVMNTSAEIRQAMRDYQNGKMGQLS